MVDAIILIGFGLTVWGVWMLSHPWAAIVGGAGCMLAGVALAVLRREARKAGAGVRGAAKGRRVPAASKESAP